jgi:hypothetical protein
MCLQQCTMEGGNCQWGRGRTSCHVGIGAVPKGSAGGNNPAFDTALREHGGRKPHDGDECDDCSLHHSAHSKMIGVAVGSWAFAMVEGQQCEGKCVQLHGMRSEQVCAGSYSGKSRA